MYQGKLEKAGNSAKSAYDYAVLAEDDILIFKAELLSVMIKMSGWYNIFFCVQDIPCLLYTSLGGLGRLR